MSGLARELKDSSIQTRGKREASSRGSSQLVVIGHIDTSNETVYASHEYDRVPMVNIDGGTMISSNNAGPTEGKV